MDLSCSLRSIVASVEDDVEVDLESADVDVALAHLSAEDCEPEVQEEVPVMVKGAGDCWKKIPGFYKGDQFEMCAADLADLISDIDDDFGEYFVVIEWCWQEDGDLHVIKAHSAWNYNCGEKWCEHDVPGAYTQREFKELLRANQTRLVGSSREAASPMDKALAAHRSPDVVRAIDAATSAVVMSQLPEMNIICPYAIPAVNQVAANDLAIPWSVRNAVPHRHPIHAAIRRQQFHEVYPKMIKSDVTFVSAGTANMDLFRNSWAGSGVRHSVNVVNPIVDLKDIGRYAGTETVPNDVFSLPNDIQTPTVVFSDSGMWCSPEWLGAFFANNRAVQEVLISHVFPLVSLSSVASPQPALYTFSKPDKNTLIYVAEGDTGGSYEQPANAGILLAREITGLRSGFTIRGGVVHSVLNSHIQVWSRYNLEVPH